jgi:hypothetical protein
MLDFMYGLVCQLLALPYKAMASQATISLINSALKEYLPQPTYQSPTLSAFRAQPAPGTQLRPSFIPQTAISASVSTSPTSAHQNHALIHAQMYAMGEKYLIPDLKSHAKLSFSESIPYISGASLCEVITEVYTSTPETDRGLRDIVLDAVVRDLNEKMRNKGLKKIAIEMVPQFGYELLERALGSVAEQGYQAAGLAVFRPVQQANWLAHR